MLNFEQEVELGKKLSIWTINPTELKIVDLMREGLPGAYIYEPIKGGKQVIVGNDCKVLTFASSLSLDKVLDDIKHNKLWDKAVDVSIREVSCPRCKKILAKFDLKQDPTLIGEKIEVHCDKCNTNAWVIF